MPLSIPEANITKHIRQGVTDNLDVKAVFVKAMSQYQTNRFSHSLICPWFKGDFFRLKLLKKIYNLLLLFKCQPAPPAS